LKRERDVRAGKVTYDCGAVESERAMESHSKKMAKTLGQTKVGGNTTRRLWAEAKWDGKESLRWTIREMRK